MKKNYVIFTSIVLFLLGVFAGSIIQTNQSLAFVSIFVFLLIIGWIVLKQTTNISFFDADKLDAEIRKRTDFEPKDDLLLLEILVSYNNKKFNHASIYKTTQVASLAEKRKAEIFEFKRKN